MLREGSSALALVIGLCASAPSAYAQQGRITIPAMEMGQALREFAVQTNRQVVFQASQLRGQRSNAISGYEDPATALRYLIGDSALEIRPMTDGGYVIAPRVQSRSLLQPTRFQPSPEPAAPLAPASFNPAPPEEPVADDIIVTAQGRAERLQDVPISVSVTQGSLLQEKNINNLQDLSARLPNVRISSAPTADFINVRGVGSSLNYGFEQSVATFVDGAYRSRSRASRAAMFDIDRVEVLKGPQTTYFGNNAIAGALNITTRKPGDKLEFNGTAFYAPAFGEYAVEAGISVPLTETLSVRISGRQSGMDGYLKNTYSGNDGPHLNDRIGRFSFAWNPSESLESNFRIDHVRMRDDETWGAEITDCPAPAPFTTAGACARYLANQGAAADTKFDRRFANSPSLLDLNQTEAVWTNKLSFGDHSLRSITSYLDMDYHLVNAVIPVPGKQGGSPIGADYGIVSSYFENYKQFSQELRFQSEHDGPITYMAGLYYMHGDLDIDGYAGLYSAPFGNFGAPVTNAATPIVSLLRANEKTDNMSAFGSITVRPVERLRISGGLRYSVVDKHDHRSVTYGTGTTANNYIPTADSFTVLPIATQMQIGAITGANFLDYSPSHRSDSKLMPSVNVQYELTSRAMAYASYVKGFKSGGFAIGESERSLFDPETVDAYEIGLKSQLFNNRLTLNIAGFYSKYDDMQETTTVDRPSGSPGQVTGNVAASISKGIEVGFSLRATDELSFNADLAYLDSRYDRYPGAPCTPLQTLNTPVNCKQDLSGKRRAFAPKFSGNIGVTYRRDIGSDYELLFDNSLFFTSRYFQQTTADPTLVQPGFAKWDARLAFGRQDKLWQLAIVGRNLTDKLTASYRQFVPSSPGSIQAMADPPRSFGLQLNVKY
ncbi:TonB-dependent receptor domain-containing protein [Sphingobium phenoxybenzoativorans]|uniref:TonB-dependent receptor domain-containing protein n=1 Tax=Sphingobium phenoxybenzoativorans TaxID=1592790 RepID=UPI000A75A750|nr:TonB-dependent receptor [Sphingobium phenoxybenzoativorans]